MLKKLLIRIAKKVLQGVLSQLMQQFNVVQDQALAPMRQMVQQVTDGIWVGEGANAFVEEVSSLFIPGVGQVCVNITHVHKGLTFALDTMEQADESVSQLVSSRLVDAFDFF